VVSVPATTPDVFWATQSRTGAKEARTAADEGVDRLLSRNGSEGILRALFDAGMPLLLLTHWQSLFSDGRASGLRGLERLLARIEKVFGGDVEWVTCSRVARTAARGAADRE
jgi:hypothetical protein